MRSRKTLAPLEKKLLAGTYGLWESLLDEAWSEDDPVASYEGAGQSS